eukprot:scaffold46839_cov248-Skeletonema_marinoi.AAC.1
MKVRVEECDVGMEDKDYAATKDVQGMIREVEFAEDMEQREIVVMMRERPTGERPYDNNNNTQLRHPKGMKA